MQGRRAHSVADIAPCHVYTRQDLPTPTIALTRLCLGGQLRVHILKQAHHLIASLPAKGLCDGGTMGLSGGALVIAVTVNVHLA